jgi:hypothetical protein
MRSFSLMTVVGMLSLVGLSSSAAASARQGRLGEECNSWSGPSCSPSFGACENRGSSTAQVDCPITRMSTAGNSGGYVFVRDYNNGSDVSCRLCSLRASLGASYYYQYCTGWQASSGYTGNASWFSFSSVSTYDSYSNYYYECTIPPASGSNFSSIIAYYFNES